MENVVRVTMKTVIQTIPAAMLAHKARKIRVNLDRRTAHKTIEVATHVIQAGVEAHYT